jgi:hypothetical protein
MENKWFNNPAKLGFDPKQSKIKEVFESDLARTLWLAIKQSHLTTSIFPYDCLRTASYLKENGVPETAKELQRVFDTHFGHPPYNFEFTETVLPYLKGEKTLDYVISQPKTN